MSLWNSSFETGNEIVDGDHKEIFSLVEQVLSSSLVTRKDKVEVAIQFLAEYVVRHFANEELLMDECRYPESMAHKKEHADFIDVAVELQEKFSNDGFLLGSEENNNDLHLSMEINKTVVGWLTKHVMGSDKKMAHYYRDWKNKQ
ncbi:MAG: bacteriohemerythrin [Defluviitaleaceae bacterium]|nr:bacteriohemerythrin [Defluviitaleaceae bacterium]